MKNRLELLSIKLIMFISSYFPLYIMIVILYFDKIRVGLLEKNKGWIIFIAIITICILISLLSILLLSNGKWCRKKSVGKLKRPDDTVLSYIMTYIIPLISGENSSMQIYLANFLLFILIGYIYIRLNLIYLNPLWAMFGYLIYRDEEEIIITNISFNIIKHMGSLKGYYLSNGIFIAHKRDN